MKVAVFEAALTEAQCLHNMILLGIKEIQKIVLWNANDRKFEGAKIDKFEELIIEMISVDSFSVSRTFVYFTGEAKPSDFLILKEPAFKGFINPRIFDDETFGARTGGLFHDYCTLGTLRKAKMYGNRFSKSDFHIFSSEFENVNSRWTIEELQRAESHCYNLFSAIPLLVQSV